MSKTDFLQLELTDLNEEQKGFDTYRMELSGPVLSNMILIDNGVKALNQDLTDTKTQLDWAAATVVGRQIQAWGAAPLKTIKFWIEADIPAGTVIMLSLDGGASEAPLAYDLDGLDPVLDLGKGPYEVITQAGFFVLHSGGKIAEDGVAAINQILPLKADITYVDDAIAALDLADIKLASYTYDYTVASEGQTVFAISLEGLNPSSDVIKVFANTTLLPTDQYTIQNDTGTVNGSVTLIEARSVDDFISIWVLKNVYVGAGTAINGSAIDVNSIPQDRVIDLEIDYAKKSDLTDAIDNISMTDIVPIYHVGWNDPDFKIKALLPEFGGFYQLDSVPPAGTKIGIHLQVYKFGAPRYYEGHPIYTADNDSFVLVWNEKDNTTAFRAVDALFINLEFKVCEDVGPFYGVLVAYVTSYTVQDLSSYSKTSDTEFYGTMSIYADATTNTPSAGDDSDALATTAFVQNAILANIVTLNSTAITLGLSHKGAYCNNVNTGAVVITIPANASVAFPIGTNIAITQQAASGTVTLAPASGVTLKSKDNLRQVDGEMSTVTLIKIATDTWHLIGMLV